MNAMTPPPRPVGGPRELETRTEVEFVGRIALDASHAPLEWAGAVAMQDAVLRALNVTGGQPLEVEPRAITVMTRTGGEGEFDTWSFERCRPDGTSIKGRSVAVDVVGGERAHVLWLVEADGSRRELGAFAEMEVAMSIGSLWVAGALENVTGG